MLLQELTQNSAPALWSRICESVPNIRALGSSYRRAMPAKYRSVCQHWILWEESGAPFKGMNRMLK